ncbi:MAG: hypothetical protein F6J95_029160 [Leptolyngbya sp. SIO1E4]|nr:hypothetical protein [Leptolyngbya sp. SIO1E4]
MAMNFVASGQAPTWFRVKDAQQNEVILITINQGKYWTADVSNSPAPYTVEILDDSQKPMASATTNNIDCIAVGWCDTDNSGKLSLTEYESR